MTSEAKVQLLAKLADDMKAERIETLDLRRKSPLTDFFLICSGNSNVHADAIAEKVLERAREQGIRPYRKSDNGQRDGWILVDFGDVILHVMLEEKRQFFDLESLWQSVADDPNLQPMEEDEPARE
ncbi:MAG: ribosome silencing factor [Fimbriimonadaceae bacterium]|nr:ribosome silencing factor [Fimbriimonadaceae bacterium]